REPAFADEVARWQSWFSPWLQRIAPVAPPASVWTRVSTALWGDERSPSDARVARSRSRSLWDNLGVWRGMAAGGVAVAVASIAVLLFGLRQLPVSAPAPHPVVVAPRR